MSADFTTAPHARALRNGRRAAPWKSLRGPAHKNPDTPITNFKYATATADIYSFGAILHDIFSGGTRTPYVELSVPGAFREIVEKCTKKNPIRRYSTVALLRADVFDALQSPSLSFGSTEESDLIELLKNQDLLSDDDWDRFFAVLEQASAVFPTVYNLFRALREVHIDNLTVLSPDLLNALGMHFSEYVRSNAHDFDYCDVLADKMEKFFGVGSVALKAHILVSLLEMGVAHNRWFVERKFLKLASPTLDANVALRLQLDINAENIDMGALLSRWEISISTPRALLHPILGAIPA